MGLNLIDQFDSLSGQLQHLMGARLSIGIGSPLNLKFECFGRQQFKVARFHQLQDRQYCFCFDVHAGL